METSLLILDREQGLKESSALHLPPAPDHPRQRIYAIGVAVEITKPVRHALAVHLSVVDPLPEAACR